MIKKNIVLFLIIITLKLFAQDKRITILGKIESDSIFIENVHIVNKNSEKGTISNQFGEFQIPVKINDTLIFSAIQFKYKELIITSVHLTSIQLIIKLHLKINELEEILIKQHNLTGYLQNDITNTVLNNHVDEFTLRLPNAGKKPVTNVDYIRIRYGQYRGVIGSLYGWVSGDKKRLKKLEKLEKEKLVIDKIRKLIKDSYFIQTLKIPKDNISHFLYYCIPSGIIKLYDEGKKNELINMIIKESKLYKKFKRLD